MNQILLYFLFFLVFYGLLCLFLTIFYDKIKIKEFKIKNIFKFKSSTYTTTSNFPDFQYPIILEWNGFSWKKSFESENPKCPKKCIFTSNKNFETNATIITFHMGDRLLQSLPPKSLINFKRLNIFINFEPPPHRKFYLKVPKDFFNLTATYRLDSDLPMPYDCLKELDNENDEDKWNQNEVENAIKSKTKSILYFVSHCSTDSKREIFVNNLKKYINITQYGGCNKNKCPKNNDCENQEISSHHFILAFENSVCLDYLTEKIFRFRKLIVPIILDRTIIRENHTNLNPFIIAASDFKSVKDLANYLEKLMNDKNQYKKYFEWTKLYKKSRSCFLLNDIACKLCDIAWKVKKEGYQKTIPDIHKWWGNNNCKSNYGTSISP